MASLFLIFVLLFALFFSWGAWKGTQRDVARDKLFDLRDEWRAFFIENGFSQELPEYAKVRRMINSYIRYTARFRLVGLLFVAFFIPRKVCLEMAKQTEMSLHSENKIILMEIRRIRSEAVSAIQHYMLYTSILLFPLICFGVLFAFGNLLRHESTIVNHIADELPPLSPDAIEMAVAA